MPFNRRSRLITQGVARSPNRAMLRAVGFRDGDFDKPIVGVANGHSTMNPCNAGIQPLVDRAMAALKDAGAMPQVFGVPTVTDGIGMGTEGMKYSLISREVIADAIETSVNGQCMDGVLVVGGCDKNMPGGVIAMARMNVPSIYVYAGTIKPGTWKGQTLTIVSPFEAVGAFTAGTMSQEDYDGIERNACPSVGACGGMYTANTMSSAFEALGVSLLGSSQMASPDPEKADSAAQSAKVLVEAIKNDLKPRDIITRESIENAISLVMATGGSTNAVLHFLAIASAAEVAWTIDDFERIRKRVPVLCDLKPSGKYVAVDLHRAGGVPQVLKMLLKAGLLHGDCVTITGRTMAEELAGVPDAPRADQDVIRPMEAPMYAQGHLAILRGNLSPEGCVAKITGLKNPTITGPARVFRFRDRSDGRDHGQEDRSRRRHRHPLRGPQGRPRHAGDAGADVGAHRSGAGRIGGPHHRRPLFRRHMGHGRRARRARGLHGRHDRAGARRRLDHDRRAPVVAAAQRERRGNRPPPRAMAAAQTALYTRSHGEIHATRVDREQGRHYGRRRQLAARRNSQGAVLFPNQATQGKGRWIAEHSCSPRLRQRSPAASSSAA
jgi:dihydroxy-acid dehydratase